MFLCLLVRESVGIRQEKFEQNVGVKGLKKKKKCVGENETMFNWEIRIEGKDHRKEVKSEGVYEKRQTNQFFTHPSKKAIFSKFKTIKLNWPSSGRRWFLFNGKYVQHRRI